MRNRVPMINRCEYCKELIAMGTHYGHRICAVCFSDKPIDENFMPFERGDNNMGSPQPEVKLVTDPLLKKLNALKLKGYHVKVRKRHGGPYGSAGEPDIEGCINGVCIQIECKAPGNKPTPLQLQRIKEWTDAGALAFWTDDAGSALEKVLSRVDG